MRALAPALGPRGAVPKLVRAHRLELLFVAAFAGTLVAQLFVPPFIGLANNGDFPKVTGRFWLGPEGGGWENFDYFTSGYVRDEKYRWESDILSSELALTAAAVGIERTFSRTATFDVRYLGLVHSIPLLGAYGLLLVALRRQRLFARVAVAGTALLIFSDVAYVSYLNSFYSDTPALLGLLLTMGAAVYLVSIPKAGLPALGVAAAGALLLITSKAQHGFLAPPVAAIIMLVCWRRGESMRRAGLIMAVVLLVASAATFAATPTYYRGQALFNLVFHQLPGHSRHFASDLEELGIDPSARQFAGMHAYSPDSPAQNRHWLESFYNASGHRKLALFYLRHPQRAFAILDENLREQAHQIRPNLSNFRRVDGRAPGALTNRFALWSNLRSKVFRLWPGHVLVWYLAVALVVTVILRWSGSSARREMGWICLGVIVMGITEFGLASLADAAETYRHLLLFHALTDVTVCFGVAFAATAFRSGAGHAEVEVVTPVGSRTKI